MTFKTSTEEKFWMDVYARVLCSDGVTTTDAAQYADEAVKALRERATEQYTV